jgi:hypothetical protein
MTANPSRSFRYALAAMAGAAIPGHHFLITGQTQTLLLALAVGAVIGLAGMALFDIAVNARYAMVNRALAKKRYRRRPPCDGE